MTGEKGNEMLWWS